MAHTIGDVLTEVDRWYNELPSGTERPRLLSKLAMLELCGWLEERFDELADAVATKAGVVTRRKIIDSIDRTYGFQYSAHVREILCAIGGERLMMKAEAAFEAKYPGDLDRLQTTLGGLWKERCQLAHASSVVASGMQKSVNAPSWAINQQRILAKLIAKFEAEVCAAL